MAKSNPLQIYFKVNGKAKMLDLSFDISKSLVYTKAQKRMPLTLIKEEV